MRNLLLMFCINLTLICCKQNHQFSSSSLLNSSKDTVTQKLLKLPDSLITKIDVLKETLIFDSINMGNTLLAKFRITNFGNTSLKIDQIIYNCDCTQMVSKNLLIAPGSIESLDFAINTSGLKKGYNERVVTILGNFRPFFKFLRVEIYIQ